MLLFSLWNTRAGRGYICLGAIYSFMNVQPLPSYTPFNQSYNYNLYCLNRLFLWWQVGLPTTYPFAFICRNMLKVYTWRRELQHVWPFLTLEFSFWQNGVLHVHIPFACILTRFLRCLESAGFTTYCKKNLKKGSFLLFFLLSACACFLSFSHTPPLPSNNPRTARIVVPPVAEGHSEAQTALVCMQ